MISDRNLGQVVVDVGFFSPFRIHRVCEMCVWSKHAPKSVQFFLRQVSKCNAAVAKPSLSCACTRELLSDVGSYVLLLSWSKVVRGAAPIQYDQKHIRLELYARGSWRKTLDGCLVRR